MIFLRAKSRFGILFEQPNSSSCTACEKQTRGKYWIDASIFLNQVLSPGKEHKNAEGKSPKAAVGKPAL